MKVGVFFPGYAPSAGGGYTFEQEIMQALFKLSVGCRHEFVFYFVRNSGISKGSLPLVENIQAQWLNPPKQIMPVRILLSKIAERIGWKRWIIPPDLPLQRAAERDHVQFIWFVTPVYWPVEVPYIATVWDIQHRLQPWFPEVGKGSEWIDREIYYADFLRRATFIITPNQVGQNELSLFYQIPSERFLRLPHPAPRIERIPSMDKIVAVRNRYGISNQYLFYPAQYWAHKNHINLLKALNILQTKHKIQAAKDIASAM